MSSYCGIVWFISYTCSVFNKILQYFCFVLVLLQSLGWMEPLPYIPLAMYSYGRGTPIFKMPGPEIVENQLPGSTQPEEDQEVQSSQVCVIKGSRIYLLSGICGCHSGLIILIICCMLSNYLKNLCQCLWDELLHHL